MKFSDQGIIINISSYGENSAILKIFSENHGVYRGFVKYTKSSKNKAIFQIGNLVSFEFKARLEENLGSFSSFDLIKSYCTKILFDKEKLKLATSLFHLIDNVILEKFALEEFFFLISEFLQNLVEEDNAINNLRNYIILEFQIIKILGYEIDISSCVATGSTDNLRYVSPKSARAVCFESGKPYENKLLKLPEFFTNYASKVSKEDVMDGLKLTEYFLLKFIFDGDVSKMKFRNLNKS
ncbi:MAG: DNA repair protein RecO [Rickettsiales bacterium]|nr:DNA repair protein RecO [Rickettsiales bacterium]